MKRNDSHTDSSYPLSRVRKVETTSAKELVNSTHTLLQELDDVIKNCKKRDARITNMIQKSEAFLQRLDHLERQLKGKDLK